MGLMRSVLRGVDRGLLVPSERPNEKTPPTNYRPGKRSPSLRKATRPVRMKASPLRNWPAGPKVHEVHG